MKVLPLKGYKSLRALNVFHTLLLGMKMLPINVFKSYEEYFKEFDLMTEEQKETLIREAVLFVELTPDEIEAILSFCCDSNNIPFERSNIASLTADKIHEMIVSVCLEISKIKIDMVSENEKKK
jgi:hypothetical protein